MDYLRELSHCELCEHRCGVDRLAGERGVCRMSLPEVAARGLHPAPPRSYTIFTAGCNFKCLHCQNWALSQYPDNGEPAEGYLDPAALARESVEGLLSPEGRWMGADRIFFSGGEPTIHLPYIERIVEEARGILPGCKVNFDTNGYMTEESLERVLAFTSSITFDIKAFFEDTHRAITGASVAPVLRNAEIVAGTARDKLWEFRIVVIPRVNEEDIPPLCQFIAGISEDLPVCFLAFRPNFVLEGHAGASAALMNRCLAQARDAGLTRASWSGRADILGSVGPVDKKTASAYKKEGAALAASYAKARGCRTHPRNCGACPARSQCAVKRYHPVRSC